MTPTRAAGLPARHFLPAAAVLLAAGMAAGLLVPVRPVAPAWTAGPLLAAWAVSLVLPAPRLRLVVAALGVVGTGWLLMAVSLSRPPAPQWVLDRPCRIRGTVV